MRWVALCGSAALACFLGALAGAGWRRRWSDAAWCASVLAVAAATVLAGGRWPWVHHLLALGTLGAAVACAVRFQGATRWLMLAGAATWAGSLLFARWVFGGA